MATNIPKLELFFFEQVQKKGKYFLAQKLSLSFNKIWVLDPDPALFISDLQDANKILIFLLITF